MLIRLEDLKVWRANRISSGDCSFDDMTALQGFIESVRKKDLVTCEECIHWNDGTCMRPGLGGDKWHDPKYVETLPDDYCSYGARIDEQQEQI